MLKWTEVETKYGGGWLVTMKTLRARVPGGWLVMVMIGTGHGLTFMPDPNHDWDGSSVPDELDGLLGS
jgi:hypothetical protein